MLHEAPVPRLQGRKTLVSRHGQTLREQRSREEKPTSDDDATPRRKRVWRPEAVE
jgi:hypothetical protein